MSDGPRVPREYYNRRVASAGARLDLLSTAKLIKDAFEDLRDRQFFDELLGKSCPDDYDPKGTAGNDVARFIRTQTQATETVWPISDTITTWSEVTLFTMLEFLFDHVSKGVKGRDHPYNGCGMHYEIFDRKAGQVEWRHAVNGVIRNYGEGFELFEDGIVKRRGPTGLRELHKRSLPASADVKFVTEIVNRSTEKFLYARSNSDDRRAAVRELADVLELLRPEVRKHMVKEDDTVLYGIANTFWIRHNNKNQHADYNPIWLSWLFYIYLATIHAMTRFQDEGPKTSTSGK